MTAVLQRMRTHPENAATDIELLSRSIEALLDCAQSCTFCADACLAEENLERLRNCIRLNLDCADVCSTAAKMLSRQHSPNWELLRGGIELAGKAADACGSECNRHASMHEHCKLCYEACSAAQEACNALLTQLRS
jgi:hypothetical protein